MYLARAGLKPVVFEQADDVGLEVNGVLHALENWSTEEDVMALLAGLGIAVNFRCEPVDEATFYGPERRPHLLSATRPLFYSVERGPAVGSLDRGLLEQAQTAGAEIRFGERVEESDADRVVVATGAPRADAHVEWVVFETAMPDGCIGFLDSDIAPGGHASLFVQSGRATLSTWCFEANVPAYSSLERTMKVASETIGVDIPFGNRYRRAVNFSVAAPWTRSKRFYFVGARAGFQDAMWGFGLRQALLSGVLAARAIVMGEDYDALCNRFILPARDVSLANRSIFNQLDGRGLEWALEGAVGRNVMGILRRHYLASGTKSMLHDISRLSAYPFLTEPACHGEECRCLWCEHGRITEPSTNHHCEQSQPMTTVP